MLIKIDGIGFVNKGAEMMLRESVRRVRENLPDAEIAVSAGRGPFISRAELGLYQIPVFRRFRIDWGQVFHVMPSRQRRKLGLVMDHEIDAVLDASGYRYSHLWGSSNVRRLAHRASRLHQKGGKYILLPQAFGPFSDQSRAHLVSAVEAIDLLYARDETSYDYVAEVVGDRPNMRIAPDFTAPLPGFLRREYEPLRGRFCVIPNRRMLDKTNDAVRDAYIPLMRQCIHRLLDWGVSPFILIHEARDEGLAQRIAAGLGEQVDVVKEADARAVKGIIGIASGVISSRYHGLVNALSQGVPALGTGWSHKYEMLFRDYGFDEGMIPVPLEQQTLDRKVQMLIDASSREELALLLRAAAQQQRDAIEDMWKEVLGVLARA